MFVAEVWKNPILKYWKAIQFLVDSLHLVEYLPTESEKKIPLSTNIGLIQPGIYCCNSAPELLSQC